MTAHRIEARWRAIGDPLPRSLVALTLATGLVDAVSFLGLGQVFVANQTGNVVFLAFALAGASGLSASAALVSWSMGMGNASGKPSRQAIAWLCRVTSARPVCEIIATNS